LALSGHRLVHSTCPLLGVKRTWRFALRMSAFDPKRTCRTTNEWHGKSLRRFYFICEARLSPLCHVRQRKFDLPQLDGGIFQGQEIPCGSQNDCIMGCASMRSVKSKIAALAIGAALVSGASANAATIDYIFTGLGTGTLGTTGFGGFPVAPDVSFTFTIVGDTGAVTMGSASGPPDNGNPFRNAGISATFVSGSLSANLSNMLVNLFNNNQGQTFPGVGFFQSPTFAGDVLGTASGGPLGSYDLTTAFAQISTASAGNFVSFGSTPFTTDAGTLTFTHISQLTFEAIVPTSQTPLPAALPLFASGLGVLGLLARRRKRKAGATI
jgi:hypothetical protein